MMSLSEKKDIYLNENEIKKSYQKRALLMLESPEVQTRMKGYALISTCFSNLTSSLQEYIREKWFREKSFKNVSIAFKDYCDSKFTINPKKKLK